MSTTLLAETPPFGAQLIGQTEKALNGFLTRALAGSDLTERDWVTLRVTAMADPAPDRGRLAARLAGVFKVSSEDGERQIDALIAHGFVRPDSRTVQLTDTGRAEYERIYADTVAITDSLWGDLPADELATAARILATVLARANSRLG